MVTMVGDVKRSIAWMKANASQYGVNPDRIILGGGSAGGHLSMLAAFDPQNPRLTPADLLQTDLTVHGIISCYGPSDLIALYKHTGQERLVGLPKPVIGEESAQIKKSMRDAGRLDILLGGSPSEVPEMYELTSPIFDVHSGCPPILLIQGEHDVLTPVSATRALYEKLHALGAPVINRVFPCTEHAFDLLLPRISPTAQSALYDTERFLALLE